MGVAYKQIPIPATLSMLRGMAGVNPLIVNYHIVSDESLPYVKHLYRYRDVKTFEKDIDYLISRYQPIGLLDLLESVKGKTVLPRNAVLLTFDDGFKELYEVVAPILMDKGVTATFFITTNLVDNKELLYDNKKSLLIDLLPSLDKPQMKEIEELIQHSSLSGNNISESIALIPYQKWDLVDEIASLTGFDFDSYLRDNAPYLSISQISTLLDSGFTFGGHSIDHARFNELSLEDQVHQATTSIDFMVNRFSLNYRVFAFPYSDHGVSRSFFNAISPHVDLTFGTQGLLRDSIPTNLQRISLEKHKATPGKTIKFHYMRRIVYRYRKRDVIIRK